MPRRVRLWPAFAITVLVVGFPALAEVRTWTDVTGKHTIEAELISATPTEVTLRRADGKEVKLPLAKLSPADRALVKKQIAADKPSEETESSDSDEPARKPLRREPANDAAGKAIRDIADRFYRDLRTKERNDARSLLTEGAQKMAAKPNYPLLKIATPDEGGRSIRIGRVKVEGSQAEVPVQVRSQNARHETTLHLREEADAWRVFAISATLGDDELTIDFEAEPASEKSEKGPDPLLALVGKPFRLQGIRADGATVDMSQFEGKVVLVDFWATWCGPCRKEMPNVLANYQQYHEQGFEVIAVSIDKNMADLRQYMLSENPPWTVLADRHPLNRTSMASMYGIRGVPSFILVGKDGRVAAVQCRGKKLGAELEKLLGSK